MPTFDAALVCKDGDTAEHESSTYIDGEEDVEIDYVIRLERDGADVR